MTRTALAILVALMPALGAAEPAPDSPRASVQEYLGLCHQGRYAEAARYLSFAPGQDGGDLARKLQAVLERHLWPDLQELSPLSHGDPDDGLGEDTDEVGEIQRSSGKRDPVRISRTVDERGARWVFTRPTVNHIDDWYAALEDRWLREHLPPLFLRSGPKQLLYWQWIALPFLVVLSWGLSRLLGLVARTALRFLLRRNKEPWPGTLAENLKGPINLAIGVLLVSTGLRWFGLYPPAEEFASTILGALGIVALFWALRSAVWVAGQVFSAPAVLRQDPSTHAILFLVMRACEIGVVVVGGISVVSKLGYPVASLLAGVGIGGLGLALAAQKTVENVFGSMAIAVDQPIRVGDFARVDGIEGTVETIGLRSTRIRTADRTLVSFPNGRLADMRIESFGPRDRIRMNCLLSLVYGTTEAQMREVLSGLEGVLRAQPKVWTPDCTVRFKELGPSALVIEVTAWFQTTNANEYILIRQEVFLQFLRVVEAAGTRFAFPTQTVHVVGGSGPRSGPDPAA